jgi:hypothetical protein
LSERREFFIAHAEEVRVGRAVLCAWHLACAIKPEEINAAFAIFGNVHFLADSFSLDIALERQ